MKSLILIGSLAIISVIAGVKGDDDNHAETAVAFKSKESFEKSVNADNPHFVMFYAPWCGHCKRLAPAWEELAVKYNKQEEKEAVIAKVDCTLYTELCSDQDVTGYPTLKFFKDGPDSGVKYREQRDLASLVKFINKQLGKEVEEENLGEPEEAKLEDGVYVLNDRSFKNHIKEGSHFVKFYAPWCGHCQKLAPTWEKLGKSFEKDSSAKIAKVDCTQSQGICQENDVKGYPTLTFFKDGKKVETYKGARNLKDLQDFVMSMKEGNVDASIDADKVPEGDDVAASLVLKIDSDDFEGTIKEGITFVKFFAPWCGHCKRLAPIWDELAKHFADDKIVKIAKVDCTSNDNKNKDLCNDQGVNGFPTLNLYKDGKKVTEYSGSRKTDDLVTFVKKHSEEQTKDEL